MTSEPGANAPPTAPRNPETPSSIDLFAAQGVVVGDRARQQNRYSARLDMPRPVQIAVVAVLTAALIVGSGWVVVTWVLPQFAPLYKTEFLIDTSLATEAGAAVDIARSVGVVAANSGDEDALALRTFGGECGAPENTTQLVDFDTQNQGRITSAASAARTGGQATLQRGIVQAIEDFSQPLARRARQVNRIIVVTRNAVDACDSDSTFVQNEIRERVSAAGLSISFRMIGYQVDAADQPSLQQIAVGADAPEPTFVSEADDLQDALDWYTNIEPLIVNANQMVDLLNPATDQVSRAAQAVRDGRLDVAERNLDAATDRHDRTDLPFEDLRSRRATGIGRQIRNQARALREQQATVVAAGRTLVRRARDGDPLEAGFAAFADAARRYNTQVKVLNTAIAELRARAPQSR